MSRKYLIDMVPIYNLPEDMRCLIGEYLLSYKMDQWRDEHKEKSKTSLEIIPLYGNFVTRGGYGMFGPRGLVDDLKIAYIQTSNNNRYLPPMYEPIKPMQVGRVCTESVQRIQRIRKLLTYEERLAAVRLDPDDRILCYVHKNTEPWRYELYYYLLKYPLLGKIYRPVAKAQQIITFGVRCVEEASAQRAFATPILLGVAKKKVVNNWRGIIKGEASPSVPWTLAVVGICVYSIYCFF